MTNETLLGPWVRRFLLEHLVGERNLACNTQRSYRALFASFLLIWNSLEVPVSPPVTRGLLPFTLWLVSWQNTAHNT